MSHLLKRTKKSCMKIIRKISSSKQLFAKKNDDDSADDATNNNNNNNSNNTNANAISIGNSNLNGNVNGNGRKANNHNDYAMEIVATQTNQGEKVNHSFRDSTESLPSITYQKQQQQQQQQSSPKKIPSNEKYTEQLLLDEDSPNNTILHKLTARLFLTADGYDFQRLQQLRSDTGSEVIQFDNDNAHYAIPQHDDDILFEKVNYKDDVRYFRHTPSNSSLDNFRPGSVASTPDYDQADYDLDNDWQVNEECNHRPWNLEPLSQQFTNFGFQATSATTNTTNSADPYPSTVNVTLGSKLHGNLQNVVITQELDNCNKLTPVIKWDINGNSLDNDDDDDNDLLPHEYLEDFDKRLSKRIAAVQQLQMKELDNANESADSSLHSSSTTLETWVDEDLLIENSIDFNSHENRCLILKV